MNSSAPPKNQGSRNAPREPVYLASQLASICDVDLKTIHNWCDRRESSDDPAELESFRTQGGHLRFHHAAVLRFLTRWGYPIPDALLQDRPHVLVVEPDADARRALVKALLLKRPGEETAEAVNPAAPPVDETLGLWSTPRYYLHLWNDPHAALISLGERTGAGAPPDLAVLSLPMPSFDARAWIHAARAQVADDPPLFVLVTDTPSLAPAAEAGVVANVPRARIEALGEILDLQAQTLLARVTERASQARLGRPRRRVPIAPKEPIYVASQVASIWNVDLKTVHNWVERGDMEAFRTPGRHLRFRRRSLLSFLRRYNMEIPSELTPERPRVMVVGFSADEGRRLADALTPRYDVLLQPSHVASLAEIGLRSAGAGLLDAVVVALPVDDLDERRWIAALLHHPDTRYTRIVTVGGSSSQRQAWQNLGVAATVMTDAHTQVGAVLDPMLGVSAPL